MPLPTPRPNNNVSNRRVASGEAFSGLDDIAAQRRLLELIYRELAGLDMSDASDDRGLSTYHSTGIEPLLLEDDNGDALPPYEGWVKVNFGFVAQTISIRAVGDVDPNIAIAFDNPEVGGGNIIILENEYLPMSIGGSDNGINADKIWITTASDYVDAPSLRLLAY